MKDAATIVEASPIARAFWYAVKHLDHGTASDLFRFELLLRSGGAYADVDVLPKIGPEALAERTLPAFGVEPNGSIEMRFIWSPSAHDLLRSLRDEAVEREETFIDSGGWLRPNSSMRGVLRRTGPKLLAEVVRKWCAECGVENGQLLIDAVDTSTPEGEQRFHAKEPEAKRIARSQRKLYAQRSMSRS